MKKQWKSLGDLSNQEDVKILNIESFRREFSFRRRCKSPDFKVAGWYHNLAGLTGCKLRKPLKNSALCKKS